MPKAIRSLEGKTGVASTIRDSIRGLIDRTGFSVVRLNRGAPLRPDLCTREEVASLKRDVEAIGLNDTDYEFFTSPAAVLGYLRPNRISFYHHVIRICQDHGVDFAGKKVLEVGAGAGYLLRILQDHIGEGSLHGSDHYEELTRLARALAPSANIFQASMSDFDDWPERYDVILCTEVIEHILDTETPIPRMLGLLAPGGVLFVSVPNGRNDMLIAGESFDGISYVGHVNFWSKESWRFFIDRKVDGRRFVTGEMCLEYANDELYAVIYND